MADGTALAKRKSSLPAPIAALIAGVEPMRVAKNLASVGGGFVAAQLGGRLVKHIDAVEHFASGGAVQEMAVDLAAGLALDAVVLAGVGAATKDVKLAFKVGRLMVVGTIIGAVLPVVAQHLADAIEHVVDMIFKPSAPAASTTDTSSPAMTAPASPGGLYDHVPGGLYDHVPGGPSRGLSSFGARRTSLYQFAAA